MNDKITKEELEWIEDIKEIEEGETLMWLAGIILEEIKNRRVVHKDIVDGVWDALIFGRIH